MIKFLFYFFIVIFNSANSQIIKNINISGLNTVNRGTVLNYLPFEINDFYLNDSKSSIHTALMRTGFFKDIIISDNDDTLNIEVIENPSIKEVVIKMDTNNLIPLDKIKENLENFNLKKSKIYKNESLELFVKQIKEVYIDGGYHNAIIDYSTEINADNLVTIQININENKITKIKSMKITGNNAFSKEVLFDLFSIGEADNFIINYFTNKDHFSQIALSAGLQKITDFYLNNGYLDITIDKVDKIKNNGTISIDIHLSEGQIYQIGNIDFSGNIINKKELKKILKANSGDIFKRKILVDGIKNITDFFTDKGYAFTTIDLKTEKKIKNKKYIVNLLITINTNHKVYINRIIIDGNTRTKDSVIRREISILEGGLYSNTELELATTKIKRLGYFEDVDMKISRVENANDRINLHFNVIETKTGQFTIGASHSNNTGISFNIGIQERNIFGTGNTLNAQLSYSKAVQDLNLYFFNPYWTIDRHSLSYGIFSRKTNGTELESGDYDINKFGINVGYGIPLDDDSNIKVGLKISKIKIKCSAIFSSSDYEPEQCANNHNRINEIYTNIGYASNTLNNYNFPTKGKKSNINLGVALPIGDYKYYKFNTNYNKYIPINKNLTFKMKLRLGIASGYDSQKLPFFERYYAGGSSSVRGFNFNSLGEKYPNNSSKGGELSVLSGISVISPLGWVKDSKSMRISAFVDAGNVYAKKNTFKVDEFRVSTGIAFVWLTPIGPLGLYAAKPIKKKEGDATKTFDFTLGVNF